MLLTTGFDASTLWSLAFATLLAVALAMQQWLASRQVRHVAAHRHAVPAAFAGVMTLEAHQRAADYTIAKTRLGMIEALWAAAMAVGWTLLGGLDAINQQLLASMGAGLLQELALLATFVLVNGAFELPLSLYKTFVLEERFGFNRTTPRLWLSDAWRGLVVGAIIGLPSALLILWMMAHTGTSWWLWAWALWMALNMLLLWAYPSLIAPVFNRFTPLPDGALKDRLEQLLQRCGYKAQGLYVMDSSRRSGHGNAYFTGVGRAKRIVLFDTLLQQLDADEIEAVLAHELGHDAGRHILKRIAFLAVVSLGGFALLGWLSRQAWFYTGLGVSPNVAFGLDAPSHALALALFLVVLPYIAAVLGPLLAMWSRRQEFEADAFATRCCPPQALTRALLKLYRDNASSLTPDPIYAKLRYSHPPAAERLTRILAT